MDFLRAIAMPFSLVLVGVALVYSVVVIVKAKLQGRYWRSERDRLMADYKVKLQERKDVTVECDVAKVKAKT